MKVELLNESEYLDFTKKNKEVPTISAFKIMPRLCQLYQGKLNIISVFFENGYSLYDEGLTVLHENNWDIEGDGRITKFYKKYTFPALGE